MLTSNRKKNILIPVTVLAATSSMLVFKSPPDLTLETFLKPVYSILIFWFGGQWFDKNIFLGVLSAFFILKIGALTNKKIFKIPTYPVENFLTGWYFLYIWIQASNQIIGLESSIYLYSLFAISLILYEFKSDKFKNVVFYRKQKIFSKLIFLSALILLPVIFLPEFAWDATWYHLGAAQHFVDTNKIINLYDITRTWQMGVTDGNAIIQAYFIKNSDILGARFLNVFELFLIFISILNFSKKSPIKFEANFFVFFCLSIPIFVWTSVHAYSDMAAALAVTGITIRFLSLKNLEDSKMIFLLFWLCGVASLLKFNAFVFGNLLLIITIFLMIYKGKLRISNLILYSAFFVCGVLPSLIRNWMVTGNSFFPFLQNIISTKHMNKNALEAFSNFYKDNSIIPTIEDSSLLKFVKLPFTIAFNPSNVFGNGDLVLALSLIICFCGIFLPITSIKLEIKLLIFTIIIWVLIMQNTGNYNIRYFVSIVPPLLIICLYIYEHLKHKLTIRFFGIIFLGCSIASFPTFSHINRFANDNYAIGALEYDARATSYGKYRVSDASKEVEPAILVNKYFDSKDKVLDLGGVQRFFLYLRPLYLDWSTWSSPNNNGEWSLSDSNAIMKLRSEKVSGIIVTKQGKFQLEDLLSRGEIVLIAESSNYLLFKV